ncbi:MULTISPECIES: exodeoxyribonuclease III [unclassified Rhodococcus (in: high G+C Gram-positive bacteria)]|uniref:exodeoxyribonuclease III n=1 Tax=unclassified Rhodococcus (in: high G+C Gram-positive bacteria) TaxID=192944 RepID=UPI001C9B6CA6|nr:MULTISPECIES: exodeoxyribonuclease III [unclassified Rhodococcus (in: high G+C Gram-positive bacteria)]MBY6677063.1 exodeoxyribonuclease III [Rhodococcus sp. BP-332]MBY6680444.1 exodeoxyribonuclease III [Rhodococcus sp. BP-316]
MRLATWNVNSVRSRVDRIVDWLERSDVDVLAIQETKCKDDQFPYQRFTDIGYQVAHVGTSQWNGVAIASRVGLDDVQIGFENQPGFSKDPEVPPADEARAIGATCGGVRVWSLYVPNGRSLEDPHYRYKLDWLATLRDDARSWLAADPQARIALVGDWNVAPTDDDVWDPALFEGRTHTSGPERDAFRAIVDEGFADVVRPFTPGPGVYTYWDYTQLRFPRREGLRIDFVLASPALAAQVTDASIDRQERKGKGASDHAPVVVELGGDAAVTEPAGA